jgi:hypothetical protein
LHSSNGSDLYKGSMSLVKIRSPHMEEMHTMSGQKKHINCGIRIEGLHDVKPFV